jgi:hypothetical protein
MRSLKSLVFVFVALVVFSSSVFAGAPSPTTEKAIPVEQVTPVQAPAAPAEVNPLVISKHFTLGLGLGGNPLIGFVEKDQFGYPRTEYGICTGIGFAMAWFSGVPTTNELLAAEAKVKMANPNIADKDVPSAVRKELGVSSLSYVSLGILNAEMGREFILADNIRTRFGFGLPTLISFGINFDF